MAEENRSTVFDLINTRVVQLNASMQGISTGLILGMAIFVATNWLVLAGGHIGPEGQPIIGPHLSLLRQFVVGYRVTFLGSFIGFAYGFGVGFIVGYSVARLYNWVVDLREAKKRK